MYEPLDARDMLSPGEYYKIGSKHYYNGTDYLSWYQETWVPNCRELWFPDGYGAYAEEIYNTENYKKRVRLLQEAIDA